jgi:hypothetical protein
MIKDNRDLISSFFHYVNIGFVMKDKRLFTKELKKCLQIPYVKKKPCSAIYMHSVLESTVSDADALFCDTVIAGSTVK